MRKDIRENHIVLARPCPSKPMPHSFSLLCFEVLNNSEVIVKPLTSNAMLFLPSFPWLSLLSCPGEDSSVSRRKLANCSLFNRPPNANLTTGNISWNRSPLGRFLHWGIQMWGLLEYSKTCQNWRWFSSHQFHYCYSLPVNSVTPSFLCIWVESTGSINKAWAERLFVLSFHPYFSNKCSKTSFSRNNGWQVFILFSGSSKV